MRELVNNYTFVIPNYLFSQYNQRLETFNTDYLKVKDQALPKKKFSFAGKSKNVAKKKAVEEVKQSEVSLDDSSNHLVLKGLSGVSVVAKKEDYAGKENVMIEDVVNSSVTIPFAVKCVYLKNIKASTLNFAAVQNATFVNNCVGDGDSKSRINLASHQIRIHNTYDTEFFLLARSNPIIEHCQRVGFGDLLETELKDN